MEGRSIEETGLLLSDFPPQIESVKYRDMHQELKDLVKHVQDIKYVCFFSIRDYPPAWYYRLYLSDVEQLLKFVEAEMRCLSPKLDSVINLKLQIGSVKEALLCLRSLADHFPETYNKGACAYSLTTVTAMAYKAEKSCFNERAVRLKLLMSGFRIAKICGGLPLFIVLVAGVLKEKEIKAELWKEIEESLGLLKGKDIHVSKLTQLWIAEGFVHTNKVKGLEDVAKGLLEDLISRNLEMGVVKRPKGKLKTCRVHDLLHKFCLEKFEQENFLLQINGYRGEAEEYSREVLQNMCKPHLMDDTFPEKSKEYRLFVHSSEDQIDLWRLSRQMFASCYSM
ncbi:hypothetical protein HAX54_022026 [Datura stramonium]|uniref:Disease resistance protein winged helix domain-containing protein n=1 Tax=Datura stramonium TaxID=4076 RepID=A0ABS8UTK6_DATST|nr:hypothetical protein [Datura stramonium]